jgi:hypothetical protein
MQNKHSVLNIINNVTTKSKTNLLFVLNRKFE